MSTAGDAHHDATLAVGTQLGAFEILAPIASGGMGSVYRARSVLTGELRALKVIRRDLAANTAFVQRFVREIQITASLAHPNLIRVFEPAMADGVMFLPMELLAGETLSAHLGRSGAFSLARTLEILGPVCDAVAKVHEHGIIHRDLKPSNIVLEPADGGSFVPKVLDFGAARRVAGEEEATVAGTLVGSVHYMAPEQARGAEDLDARVDQYALAVIAYQMLTGSRPYENDGTATALAKLLERAPYPRPTERAVSLPAAVDAVLARAMSHDREARYGSVADFRAALAPLVAPGDDAESTVALAPEAVLARSATARRVPAPLPPVRSEPSTFARAAVASTTTPKASALGLGRVREVVAFLAIVVGGVTVAAWLATSSRGPQPLTVGASTAPESVPIAAPPARTVAPEDDPRAQPAATITAAAPPPSSLPAAASATQTPTPRASARPKPTATPSSAPPCTPRPGVPCPP